MATAGKQTFLPLSSHEQFEAMYSPEFKGVALIYFTANWCGACKRVNWDFLFEEFPELAIYKCDVDENNYTPGYCGVRSIPTFLMVGPAKQLIGPMQSSDTGKIAAWIKTSLTQVNTAKQIKEKPA